MEARQARLSVAICLLLIGVPTFGAGCYLLAQDSRIWQNRVFDIAFLGTAVVALAGGLLLFDSLRKLRTKPPEEDERPQAAPLPSPPPQPGSTGIDIRGGSGIRVTGTRISGFHTGIRIGGSDDTDISGGNIEGGQPPPEP